MQRFSYVRLYSDEAGESHFETVTAELEPVDFAPPAAPLNVARIGEATALSLVGGSADWAGSTPHPSPAKQVMCGLLGEFEVTASDGTTQLFGPGSVLLLEDTEGKGHSTRLLSDQTVVAATTLSG